MIQWLWWVARAAAFFASAGGRARARARHALAVVAGEGEDWAQR
ncbi:hypothetical protein [Streptomyces sp. Je 1-369]|nr:hypothetical protein [Streptomyces sp. Je 1-369]WAL96713.1 hypothetical protein NOO62_20835 [Streptomyces sp. Je 1-369]